MKLFRDAAISPVIGVLLMLVVTIIIAAVVSAFAGGLSSEQHKTLQASIGAKSIIQNISGTQDSSTYLISYPTGYTAINGIEFENKGGDPFLLSQIDIRLISDSYSRTYTLTPGEKINTSYTCLPKSIKSYTVKVGGSSSDKTISPGDKFMLYADNNYKSKTLMWQPTSSNSTYGAFTATVGTRYGWAILDRRSKGTIATGELII